MLTQNSDFTGRFAIPFAEDTEPNSEGNNQELVEAIEIFEPECLVTVLGYSLYEELKPELLKQPFVPGAGETADQKWIDLVNGTGQWQGLKKVTVPYIFYMFLQNDNESYTGVGVAQENPKGAERVSARNKAVKAWREFHKQTVGAQESMRVERRDSIRGPMTGVIYHFDVDKYWSLYKFMYENSDTYTNWAPSKVSNITHYGI